MRSSNSHLKFSQRKISSPCSKLLNMQNLLFLTAPSKHPYKISPSMAQGTPACNQLSHDVPNLCFSSILLLWHLYLPFNHPKSMPLHNASGALRIIAMSSLGISFFHSDPIALLHHGSSGHCLLWIIHNTVHSWKWVKIHSSTKPTSWGPFPEQ